LSEPGSRRYDFIIVGAGSAGAALAYRLSADPTNRVLVLEAGPADNFWSSIPMGYSRLINNPAANWCYCAEPEASTNGRRLPVPRGRMLGGSSAINGLVFVRGQSHDYNTWAQMGNHGWSYEDVLPVFKRMESYAGGSDEFRGRGGPLKVTDPDGRDPLFQSLIAAAQETGIPHVRDYNGVSQEGISMSQATIANGKRVSTAYSYLNPVKYRSNLEIVTGALTTRLIIEGKRCRGVYFSRGDAAHIAHADAEVIVSAGSINSPALLELSGIGQPDRLQAIGIEVRHPLPGVGENLRDHYAPRTRWAIDTPRVAFNHRAKSFGLAREISRYLLTGTGMIGMPAAPIRAFVRSREGLMAPDVLLGWVPLLYEPGFKVSEQSGVTCYAHPMRPESKGTVHISSSDPQAPPAIAFNFLSTPPDAEVAVRAIRIVRSIMSAPTMQALGTTELAPGATRQSDGEILQWVRAAGETTYHPVGTCKMGQDNMSVVDEHLRVRGLAGLRVADASIMPTLISGNTNAPSIMIGEKASDLILGQR
jgi:choline dehydrogenase